MLAIRLPDDIELRLDALAKATGRTKTTSLDDVEKELGLAD